MAVRWFFLLKVFSGLAAVAASPIGCSIRHNLPIVSDRQPFPSMYSIVRDRTREQLSPVARYEEVCIIASVTAGTLSIRRTFPAHRTIELFHPMIPFFGPNLFARLNATTVSLELRKGSISELYFGSANHLESLKISDIGLGTFNVVPETNSILRALAIHDRQLSTITPNIRYLEELQLLDLSGCSLTVFQLELVKPMRWLTALNLAENQLELIDTGDDAIVLPELLMFDVQLNRLQEIDRFPEVFPGLKFTRLTQNDWQCEWVGRVRATIWTQNITVLGSDFGCGTRPNNGGLCCTPAERAEERIAITKTMLSVLAELEPSVSSREPNREDSSTGSPLLTVKVFENDTIEGVIGVEMQNVGVYLQEPVRVA
ncbi:uncharacterized protein LOC118456658 [Anopheles albimanus]|uniref:Uncharacterized protein n=1 Tax=Anopheles albimanus TaxID=7167 RepID=A0A1Y9G8J1_ANOAL|nr:uncharacterized protein LOC118456658 [Anopheles albimanus]